MRNRNNFFLHSIFNTQTRFKISFLFLCVFSHLPNRPMAILQHSKEHKIQISLRFVYLSSFSTTKPRKSEDKKGEGEKTIITRWAFAGDEDLRVVRRISQEKSELLKVKLSSESSTVLIREMDSWSNLMSKGFETNGLSQNKRWDLQGIRTNRGLKPLLATDKTLRTKPIFFISSVLALLAGLDFCNGLIERGSVWLQGYMSKQTGVKVVT